MPAVVEATLVEEGPELGEIDAQALGIDPPRAHLAYPRRVHDVAPRGDRHDECGAGRVLPRAPFLADLADAEVQARIECVQQAGLPDARLTGEHRLPPAEEIAQRGQPLRLLHGGPEDLIARRSVATAQGVERAPVEVDLVEDERSEEHTSELQSQSNLVCRLLLEKKKKTTH